jgi:hypothetical protein
MALDLSLTGGAKAIAGPALKPGQPTASRKVVRGPDGAPRVIYVDGTTGAEVTNLSGYQVVEQSNISDLTSLGLSPTEDKKEPTVAQQTIQGVKPQVLGEGDHAPSDGKSLSSSGRTQANNFGYVNKPTGAGLANFVPGPVGMVSKAVNTGINMNNVGAVNSARGMMGLDDVGFGGTVKGALKDNKGKVADVNINGGIYSVGLEALDAQGKTTMTPQEANARARANNVSVVEATEEEAAAAQARFEQDYGKKGFFSSAKNFIDDMFTSPEEREAQKAEQASRSQNSGSNFSPSKSGFADMIGGEQQGVGKEAYSTPGAAVSGAARSTAGKVSSGGIGRGSSDKSGSGSGSRSNPGTSGNMGAGGGTTSGHGPGIGSA